MGTAIVTDSTAYLSPQVVQERGIGIVPLHVIIGGHEFREGVDVTADDVAQALRAYTPVTTSRPAPAAFLRVYEELADTGADAIVSVHISEDLSSTIGSARLAAASSPVPVTVVDSRTMGSPMGYAVLSGADAAAAGATPADVAAVIASRCAASTVVFYVDTLEHLRRGGRIGTASALLGSALAIKPILGLREGQIVPLEKVRTASRAIARLEELAVQAAEAAPEGVDLAVHHLDSVERADNLAQRLTQRLALAEDVPVIELGAVVGAHVGPGTLAIGVVPRVHLTHPS